MENEHNNEQWLDDVLGSAPPESELGPDEHAVSSAGLIHPNDYEFEMIMAEHRETAEPQKQPLQDTTYFGVPGANDLMGANADAPVYADPVYTDPVYTDEYADEPEYADAPEYADDADYADEPVYADAPEYADAPVYAEAPAYDGYYGEEETSEPTQFFTPQEAAPVYAEPAEYPVEAAPVYGEEYTEEELPEEAPVDPDRKGRPKRKKGYGLFGIPHILSTFIWLAIIVVIGISFGRTLWLCCADLMAFGKEPKQVIITIEDTDTIDTIAERLGEEGLVRYPGLFKYFAEITGKAENISPGTFTLDAKLDYNAMINGMTYYGASRQEIDVTFPEGYTCRQIFALLEEKGVCTVEELEAYAAEGELGEYWFLEGVERGDKYCLEGYLFPDTYTFYTNDEPGRVLEKFLDAFDMRFTDIMRERLVTINERFTNMLKNEGHSQEYIDSHQITIREIVIIASMIERESSGAEESYIISSVIYNRLSDSSQPPYLNIDAAVIYGLGGKIDPETGESIPLTKEDMATDTPYNTYLHAGLTPGPISNPGLDSLDAALVPEDNDYLYYALDPATRTHQFFEDYDDFLDFIDSVDYD